MLKRPRTRLVTSFVLLLVLPAAAAAFPNPLQLFGIGKEAPTSEPSPARPLVQLPAGAPVSFAAIAGAAKPAVVNISTTQTVRNPGTQEFEQQFGPFGQNDPFPEFFKHFFPSRPRSFTQRSLGSGVIIDADGYIVTNAHVVKNADTWARWETHRRSPTACASRAELLHRAAPLGGCDDVPRSGGG
jgi:S1-C subfamily serine protease